MATNLTNQLIKNEPLIDNGKAKEIYDADVTNLLIMIGKTKKVFYYRYRIDGKSRKDRVGEYPYTTLKEARSQALEMRILIEKGIDPREPEKEEETYLFEDVVQEYKENHVSNLADATQDVYQYVMNNLDDFNGMKISEIEITHVSKFLQKKRKKSDHVALTYKNFLSGMYSYAIQMGYVKINPVRDSLKISKPEPKNRFYDEKEIQEIYKALPETQQPLADIIQFLFLTGKRKGETLKLKYEMVDFETHWLTIPAELTKNSTVDEVYLTDSAMNIIKKRQKRYDSEFIFSCKKVYSKKDEKSFTQRVNNLHGQIRNFRKKCGIDDFTPHDIRRSITTLLSQMKIPVNVKDLILNNASSSQHSKIRQTYDVYDYRDEQKEALEKLETKLEEIIEKTSPNLITSN